MVAEEPKKKVANKPPLQPWRPAVGNLTTGRLNGNDIISKKAAGMQVQAKTGRRPLADVTNTGRGSLSHQSINSQKLMKVAKKPPLPPWKPALGSLTSGRLNANGAILKKDAGAEVQTTAGRRLLADINNANGCSLSHQPDNTPKLTTGKRENSCLSKGVSLKKKVTGSRGKSDKGKTTVFNANSGRGPNTRSVLPSKIAKDKASSKPRILLPRQKVPIVHASSKAPVVLARKATSPSSKIVEARISSGHNATLGGNFAAPSSDESYNKKEDITCECTSEFRSDNMTAIFPKFKQARRRSYTSLLVEGFKSQLPSIDDSTNHLEVPEYVNDIYQYYWTMETLSPLLENYMTSQTEITAKMRSILVNWLNEAHLDFELMQESLFLTVQLVDHFLSNHQIRKNELQLVGITALLLASKYEDYWHPKITDLLSISAEVYTRDQVLSMEKLILKKLDYRLNFPTLYVFMLRFLKAAQADKKLEYLAFYLVELCLVEYNMLGYKPSLVCASAIYVARYTQTLMPTWTDLLIAHTHYEECQLKPCADMILKFHKNSGKGSLRVTYEKYMMPAYSHVARIRPVEMLPL